MSKVTPYQENIDGEEVTILADFTDLPGGGVDVEELLEALSAPPQEAQE